MRLLLLAAALLCRVLVFAQPSNDDCSGALFVPISLTGACNNPVNATTVGATSSGVAACSGTAEDDVWFRFTATKTEHVISVNVQAAVNDPVIEVFSGTCGSLVSIKCSERKIASDVIQDIVTNLTVGQDYYVRFYGKVATSLRGPITMCVYEPVANDECTGAIPLTVNTDTSWANYTNVSVQYSTASMSGCVPFVNGDVWYKFVASDSIQLIHLKFPSVGANANHGIAFDVYGGTCGSLSGPLYINFAGNYCYSPVPPDGFQAIHGLTAGNTYYLRFSYDKSRYSQLSFSFALSNIPANDVCANAIDVPVNAGSDCITKLQGDIQNATFAAQTGCTQTGVSVWYKFTAASSRHIISVKTPGHQQIGDFDVWSGNCGSLQAVLCDAQANYSNENLMEVTELTPGNVYFIRVSGAFQGSTFHYPFDICITTPGVTLANDDCSAALPLSADASQYTLGSLSGFTSTTMPSTQCYYTLRDVWFKFTPSFNAGISIRATFSPNLNNSSGLSVFSGTCGSLTNITCNNVGASSMVLNFSGQAAQTYYIRVTGTFTPVSAPSPYFISVAALSPLPVTLMDFRIGKLTDRSISLNWLTTQESKIRAYYIQRSLDGINFSDVGSIAARNQANNDYSFTDNQPLPGRNYYRLKIVDVDGNIEYSKIIDARLKGSGDFSIYSTQAGIRVVNEKNTVVRAGLAFYDGMGRLLLKQEVVLKPGINNISKASSPGVLLVHLTTPEGTTITKLKL